MYFKSPSVIINIGGQGHMVQPTCRGEKKHKTGDDRQPHDCVSSYNNKKQSNSKRILTPRCSRPKNIRQFQISCKSNNFKNHIKLTFIL